MSGVAIDLRGDKYGLLNVLARGENTRNKGASWWCLCDCGEVVNVSASSLRSGNTQSCGCYQRERVKQGCYKHGLSHDRLYRIWTGMMYRCNNKKASNYKYYGGKGIKVCDEWQNILIFREWSIAHGYKDGLTIDRINPCQDYSPENCEWVSNSENVRRSNITRKAGL